jgi:hypothetical protein
MYATKTTAYPKGGIKRDVGKPRADLLPARALTRLLPRLTDGAEVYGEWNWLGLPPKAIRAAMARHFYAYMAGGDKDEGPGSHLAAVALNALFLLELAEKDNSPHHRRPLPFWMSPCAAN